jgi:hypothetical protein
VDEVTVLSDTGTVAEIVRRRMQRGWEQHCAAAASTVVGSTT